MSEERVSIGPLNSAEGPGFGSSSAGAKQGPPRKARRGAAARAADPGPYDPPAPIEESVERINARLLAADRALLLRFDPQTGVHVAEVTNTATGQVLQQIPSRDLRHLAELLQSWADGDSALVDLSA